jgi:hypothetical protein
MDPLVKPDRRADNLGHSCLVTSSAGPVFESQPAHRSALFAWRLQSEA